MNNTRRARFLAIIDSELCVLVFGAGLPLLIAFLLWGFGGFFEGNVGRRDRFDLFGHDTMLLVVAVALTIGVWTIARPRGRISARVFAIVLGFGFGLAAMYAGIALLFFALPLATFDEFEPGLFLYVAFALPLALAQLLTTAVFFRAASRAWKSSALPARDHPQRAVLITVAGFLAAGALVYWIGVEARNLAMEKLRSDRPDAVERALGPLKIAAFLFGEDDLLPLYRNEADESVRERFDEAFRQLTGQTAQAREAELSPGD